MCRRDRETPPRLFSPSSSRGASGRFDFLDDRVDQNRAVVDLHRDAQGQQFVLGEREPPHLEDILLGRNDQIDQAPDAADLLPVALRVNMMIGKLQSLDDLTVPFMDEPVNPARIGDTGNHENFASGKQGKREFSATLTAKTDQRNRTKRPGERSRVSGWNHGAPGVIITRREEKISAAKISPRFAERSGW